MMRALLLMLLVVPLAHAGVTRQQLLEYRALCEREGRPMRVRKDLGFDLRKIDLSKVALAPSRRVTAVDFSDCDLSGADLRDARISGASFKTSLLHRIRGEGMHALACDFTGVQLREASLTGARLDYSRFYLAVLFDSDFSKTSLVDVEFVKCVLQRVAFAGATLQGTRFAGSKLIGLTGITRDDMLALDAANRERDFRSRAYPKGIEGEITPRKIYLAIAALLALLGAVVFRGHRGLWAYRFATATNALAIVGGVVAVMTVIHQPVVEGSAAIWPLRLMIYAQLLALALTALFGMQHAVVRLVKERREERALLLLYIAPTIFHGVAAAVDLTSWGRRWGVL